MGGVGPLQIGQGQKHEDRGTGSGRQINTLCKDKEELPEEGGCKMSRRQKKSLESWSGLCAVGVREGKGESSGGAGKEVRGEGWEWQTRIKWEEIYWRKYRGERAIYMLLRRGDAAGPV